MSLFRRAGWLLLGVLVTALAVVLAGRPVVMAPQRDPVRPADVIVVLGGGADESYDVGIELAERGMAPEVLISQADGADDPRMDRYCGGRFRFRVACFVPDTERTDGEAREIVRRATIYGWRHLIVVTATADISRTRYLVGRCFDGELTLVAGATGSGPKYWAWMYARQSAGYIRAFVNQRCEPD
ncbi:YdcF family protein [Nocardia sp. NPDC059177]|uniref:YdcF family protein n=1 Tax=Nocardia sp. NPDC059177 TaxID=3346759 RepID=UPI0036C428A9